MSNRSHLVPTPTVTKNGVQTTVYVKPRATSAVRLPQVAPIGDSTKAREQLKYDTANALVSSGWSSVNGTDEDRTEAHVRALNTMKSYSADTLHAITDRAETEPSSKLLHKVAYDKAPEDLLIDWMMFHSEDSGRRIPDIDPILRGFAHYEMASQQEPEKRFAQGNAILRLIDRMAEKGWSFITSYSNEDRKRVVHIADAGIRNLITTHDPDTVADLIIERDITNAEQLAGILEDMRHTGQPLSEGVL